MFHPKVIADRLTRQARLRGWFPQYHSAEEVAASIRHLDTLINDEGYGPTRELTPDEVRFIQNERVLCMCDARYYYTRYCKIKTKEGLIKRFIPNVAQEIILDIWADLEVDGRMVSSQNLKARQLGNTTLAELEIGRRVQFIKDTTAVVGSARPDRSTKMVEMIQYAYNELPWWLRPAVTSEKTGELLGFGRMGSKLIIQHGAQRLGIARGDTVQCWHLSEVSEFLDPSEAIDASLMFAAHEFPWGFRVMESTASGYGPESNWWHKNWLLNKEHYWAGGADFCPIFLPWFVGTDLYPTYTWLRSHPIPRDWQPSQLALAHAEKAKAYVHNTSYLRKHLGDRWEMPKEQVWHWEVRRKIMEAKGELGKFYQEMPADDNEAFQSSGHSVFGVELISEKREQASQKVEIYGLVGDPSEIPILNRPDEREIDHTKPPINITARPVAHLSAHEYQLIPLKKEGYPVMNVEGKVLIWEMPEEDEEYVIGVDTAEGIGLDRTVVEVLRKGNLFRNDAQVAELASKHLGAMDIWPHILALATLYSPRRNGELRQAKLVIECMHNGETTQTELRKLGWRNFHQWIRYDKKKLDQSKSTRLGWYMTSWARDDMLTYFIKAVRDGWVDFNSPWLINEMAHLEKEGPRGKLEAMLGEHDDRVIAFGIAFFSAHILDLRGGQRQDMNMLRQKAKEEARRAPTYSPGWQGMDVRAPWPEDGLDWTPQPGLWPQERVENPPDFWNTTVGF